MSYQKKMEKEMDDLLASISKQFDEKMKQFDEKQAPVLHRIEFLSSGVDEMKKALENYTRKTDDRIESWKPVTEQAKLIESLLGIEKYRDLKGRANNIVIYGIPNVNAHGLTPPEWYEETRKLIESRTEIELPAAPSRIFSGWTARTRLATSPRDHDRAQ